MKTKRIVLLLITLSVLFTNMLGACTSAHTHEYTTIIIRPTCTEEGYTQYTCECGHTYKGDIIQAKGHNYQEEILVAATCSSQGKKAFKCTCGYSYNEEYSLEEKTGAQVYEQMKESVVEIITYDKNGNEYALGTGFVYSSDGKIITNYHVIEDSCSAKITLNDKTYVVKQILAYDKDVDLAVLKIDANELKAVSLCNQNHIVGKTIYAIGSSKGLTSTFSQGIITYADREIDGVHYVQHDAAISSGNSGGPLVNGYCEVIGINTMTMRDSQNLNFAISVNEITELNFSSPLTYAEFYEKESDSFKKLKNFIMKNGKFDSEKNEYKIDFETYTWSSGYKYHTGAIYDLIKGTIQLTCFIYNASGSYAVMSFLKIQEIGTNYKWSFIDIDANYMEGNIYSTTFTSSTILSYTSKIGFTYNAYDARQVASEMIYTTLSDMTYDYSEIGITAEDLGFYYI